ncbi:MAG: CPBP family glutamic-type intramembrane protease [Chloroflexota bacterium]
MGSKLTQSEHRLPQPTIAGERPWRQWVLFAFWVLSTVGLLVLLWQGDWGFDRPAAWLGLLASIACTVGLLRWLPGPPLAAVAGRESTKVVPFALVAVGATAVLFALTAVLGRGVLFLFVGVAGSAAILRWRRIGRREALYAGGLALVAGVAGLGAGWISYISFTGWAALQVPLVLAGLLAGWGFLAHGGLLKAGIGRSLFLAEGAGPALRGFAWGAALSLPWALLNVLMGGTAHDRWVTAWWQPLVALQPGISEEAWGRVFLVSLLFLGLRRWGATRVALAAAVAIAGYWFAYLHTEGGAAGIVSTVLIGTLYSLPLSYVWLRRGLEAAIGFHFFIDFLRFATAYLFSPGLLV